jgi:hypothetical protein
MAMDDLIEEPPVAAVVDDTTEEPAKDSVADEASKETTVKDEL